jgi:hypothetical protein
MKIPQKLKVGGRDYRIYYPHIFSDSSLPHYGLHDSGGQTIKISQKDEFNVNRNDQSILHTFIHETLHAIDNVFNGGRLTGWEKGEETINQLAEGLMQVIRDNKLDFKE